MCDGRRERRLLVRLEAARQVYNACLGESLKRLTLMRESWEYQAARKLPKGEPKSEAWKLEDRHLVLSGSGFSLANTRCTTMPNHLGIAG